MRGIYWTLISKEVELMIVLSRLVEVQVGPITILER